MMTTDNLGNTVATGVSGIVNIATVKAVSDTAKKGFGYSNKKSYSAKKSKSRKSKGFDIWWYGSQHQAIQGPDSAEQRLTKKGIYRI